MLNGSEFQQNVFSLRLYFLTHCSLLPRLCLRSALPSTDWKNLNLNFDGMFIASSEKLQFAISVGVFPPGGGRIISMRSAIAA